MVRDLEAGEQACMLGILPYHRKLEEQFLAVPRSKLFGLNIRPCSRAINVTLYFLESEMHAWKRCRMEDLLRLVICRQGSIENISSSLLPV